MISAKRNKEGIITVSGLEVGEYELFFRDSQNYLYVERKGHYEAEKIPIEDEKESTSRVFIPNVSDFKITYIPSEKTLVDLGFTRNLTGWDKKFFTELRYIGYTIADNEFEDEDGNALFLHSDSELKMLVDILSRES